MEEKNKTGYPHIDKPWMKYYDEKNIGIELPKKTLYENVRDNVQSYLGNTAITYNGETINYDKFLENIKLFAKVLVSIDVSKGSRVLYLMANIPEIAYSLYGTNFIGAISDYVDPRPDSLDFKVSAQKILRIVKDEKINSIVCLDQCYLAMIKPIERELKEIGIDNILLVTANDSMTEKGKQNYIEEYLKFNGLKKTIQKLKYLKNIQESIKQAVSTSCLKINYYSDLKDHVNLVTANQEIYNPDTLTAITHSSGTSGAFPKAIPLTNEGIISYAFQLSRSNTNTNFGDSSLQILPFFSAYGLGIANFGYSNAYNMIQVPEFSPNNLGKLISKYRPNAIMGTPNWYLSMPKDKTLKKSDLSFIKIIGYGGASMNVEDEATINDFLLKHNSSEKISKGHGMSEGSGGTSYAVGQYNKLGSMGIPMIDTIYAIVDPETKELIKFENGKDIIQGEFIISSPAIVHETLDDKLVIKHGVYDGIDFIYTGDIGEMDRNGVLTFLERNDRAFTRYDGFKVKPYVIENVIKKVDVVKDCIVTPYFDEEHYGNLIQANIILKEDCVLSNEIIEYIIDNAFTKNSTTSTRQIPSKIVIKKSFPMTKNDKVYYKGFNEIGVDDIEYMVHLDETSISVGNILIEKVQSKKYTKKI